MDREYTDNNRRSPGELIMIAILAVSFIFLYRNVLLNMASQWRSNDIYTHGFLVPVISLYLVWTARRSIKEAVYKNGLLAGILFLLIGFVFFAAGFLTLTLLFQEISIPFVIAGLISILYGRELLKKVSLPIAYLFFMVPIWNVFTDPLVPKARLLTAFFASKLLQVAGVPVYRTGTQLELPNITLEVAVQCSGVNFLIAVIGIGIPLAFIFMKSWKRRIALVVAGAGISFLFNGIRVGLIGILSYYGFSEVLHGPGHVLQALSVSAAGYLVLFAGCAWFSDRKKEDDLKTTASAIMPEHFQSNNRVKSAVVLVILFVALGLYVNRGNSEGVPLSRSLNTIPSELQEWKGYEAESCLPKLIRLKPDNKLSRVYTNSDMQQVCVYIGYFEQQKQSRKLTSYLTSDLFDGDPIVLKLPEGRTINASLKVYTYEKEKKLTLSWIDQKGETMSSLLNAKMIGMKNMLIDSRSNGAIVVLSTDLPDGTSLTAASAQLSEFAKNIATQLQERLP